MHIVIRPFVDGMDDYLYLVAQLVVRDTSILHMIITCLLLLADMYIKITRYFSTVLLNSIIGYPMVAV